MLVSLGRCPSLVCGPGAVAGVLARAERPVAALVDRAVLARVDPLVASADQLIIVDRSPSVDLVARTAGRLAALAPATVVACGGGSTLDLAKLACLGTGSPTSIQALTGQLQAGARVGLVRLSSNLERSATLVAVPTTLGTGSESTAVACVDVPVPDGVPTRTLVMGEQLRADRILLDADLTATLPASLVIEAGLEVLVRVYGALVGSSSHAAQADLEAISMAVQAGSLLDRACSSPISSQLREELALLSSCSHRFLALAGRGPYPSPLWFLGNELSMALGATKMAATAALMSAWLDRVTAGDARWGRATVHSSVWPLIGQGRSVRDALTQWGFRTRLPGTLDQRDLAARRLFERWAGPLPMLGRFDADELHRVVTDAVQVGP